jgi:hypothetical protein
MAQGDLHRVQQRQQPAGLQAVRGNQCGHRSRGKESTLTPLGEKLVWADHRIHARLKPVLESLASELSAEIAQVMAAQPAVLRLQAPHGFAIERLVDALGRAGASIEHRYGSSTEAVAALHDGVCDVAGLHIPLGLAQEAALAGRRRPGGDRHRHPPPGPGGGRRQPAQGLRAGRPAAA